MATDGTINRARGGAGKTLLYVIMKDKFRLFKLFHINFLMSHHASKNVCVYVKRRSTDHNRQMIEFKYHYLFFLFTYLTNIILLKKIN